LKVLFAFGSKDEVKTVALEALNDSSYAVMANGFSILAQTDSVLALNKAFEYRNSENQKVQYGVLSIYSQFGGADVMDWMKTRSENTSGYSKAGYVWQFKKYVLRLGDSDVTSQGITHLKGIYFTSSHSRVKKECIYALKEIEDQLKKKSPTKPEEGETGVVDEKLRFQLEYLSELFSQIKATETDSILIDILESK
jgi:hypothetical protein